METKINIAEILRNKPHGIKLYSPIFGNCTFCYIKDETNNICVKSLYGEIRFFNFEGLYNTGGECLLFPSKEMRDWSRFAWKRGDILADNDGETMVIFDKWYDDTYTSFYCRHYFNCEDKSHPVYYSEFLCTTVKYSFKNNQYANHDYLKAIEEKLGGKLNRETLEIEKVQPEFKDGDILSCDEDSYTKHTTLIFHKNGDTRESIVSLIRHKKLIEANEPINDFLLSRLNYASEDEKKELFDTLTKAGKYWDVKRKEVVDLKPKYEFKPMDWCLMKYIGQYNNRGWELCQYAYTEHRVSSSGEQRDFYHAVGGEIYAECIPYKGNEHLLGTRNKVEN